MESDPGYYLRMPRKGQEEGGSFRDSTIGNFHKTGQWNFLEVEVEAESILQHESAT